MGLSIFFAASLQWIWAIINIARSKRIDLGVVTFGWVIFSTVWERYNGYTRFVRWATTISSIFVAINFSLVLIFWKPIQKDLAKSRSVIWLKVFVSYCACLMIFWLISAYKSFFRGETSTSSSYKSVQPPPWLTHQLTNTRKLFLQFICFHSRCEEGRVSILRS